MLEQSLNNITRLKVLNQIEEQSDCEWYLLGHPEDFLNEKTMQTFTSVKWANFVSHIFIDEAHCVMQWGNDVFRPKYRKLYQLRALFQNAVFIAVTATATLSTRKEMCTSLGMTNAAVVSMNPDRTNIRYTCCRRPSYCGGDSSAEQSYAACFNPIIGSLKNQGFDFPKTIIYTGLKWCGYGHQLACQQLRVHYDQRYYEVESVSQYHAHLPAEVSKYKKKINCIC